MAAAWFAETEVPVANGKKNKALRHPNALHNIISTHQSSSRKAKKDMKSHIVDVSGSVRSHFLIP
jgi:hypothetical protein